MDLSYEQAQKVFFHQSSGDLSKKILDVMAEGWNEEAMRSISTGLLAARDLNALLVVAAATVKTIGEVVSPEQAKLAMEAFVLDFVDYCEADVSLTPTPEVG